MAIEQSGMMRRPGMAMPEESVETEVVATTIIPAAMLGGQKVSEGDVVRLEVVSVDGETGDVTARYAMPSEETGGIDEMAAEFNP